MFITKTDRVMKKGNPYMLRAGKSKRRYLIKKILSVAMVLFLISCGGKYPEGVRQAMKQMDKKNQRKFERVFEHYGSPEDSLKLKASYFLVENLADFGSYEGGQIDKYDVLFDILADKPPDYRENLPWYANEIGYIFDSLQQVYGPMDPNTFRYRKDEDAFTAQGMIRYIDQAFEAWNNPWSRDVSFGDFCEYVLPYRNFSEPVEDWRSMFLKKFSWIYDSVTPGMSRLEVANMLNRNSELKYSRGFDRYIVSIAPGKILKAMYGNCADNSNYKAMIMRSFGIPASVDFFPQYGSDHNIHYWNAVMDRNGNFVSFEEALNDINAFVAYKYRIAKVFRRTFSKNPELVKLIEETNGNVPSAFKNPRMHDVTSEYVAVTSVKLKLENVPKNSRYVYLGIFNDAGWTLIDYARIKGNREAEFKDLGRTIMYLPLCMENNRLVPVSVPFEISEKGFIRYVEPGKQTERVILTRKYHLHRRKINWLKCLAGGRFQGANKSDFSDAVTLAVIGNTPGEHGEVLKTNTGRKFRYFRFVFSSGELKLPYDGDGASIAEIECYDASGNKLTGKPVGSEGRKYNPYTPEFCFDNDPLTFFEDARYGQENKFVGLAFERPVSIGMIKYIPRNDLNSIQPGNTYELFYWDNRQFRSLGRKTAEDTLLVYDNVPEGAMLWLRNLSGGREERIFTWENNRQQWW
jgi:hypothetical protein